MRISTKSALCAAALSVLLTGCSTFTFQSPIVRKVPPAKTPTTAESGRNARQSQQPAVCETGSTSMPREYSAMPPRDPDARYSPRETTEDRAALSKTPRVATPRTIVTQTPAPIASSAPSLAQTPATESANQTVVATATVRAPATAVSIAPSTPAKPAAPRPVVPPPDLPPAQINREGNQAVVALLESADKHIQNKDLDKAGAALERALRVEPRNASIWHDLAQIRLHQGQYQQAESLASKSNNLASSNPALQARNAKLIATARAAQPAH